MSIFLLPCQQVTDIQRHPTAKVENKIHGQTTTGNKFSFDQQITTLCSGAIKSYTAYLSQKKSQKQPPRCVLKICSTFTGEYPCRSAISIELQSNFFEIALRHGCSPVNLLHIFRTPFPKNTSGWLLLKSECSPQYLRSMSVVNFF